MIPLHLVLATPAKVLCSAVFLSGRSLEDARRHSLLHALFVHHLHDVLLDLVEVAVDDDERAVTVSVPLDRATVEKIVTGYRAYYGDLDANWQAETERLVTLGSVSRTAQFLGDQGSVIVPSDDRSLGFTPVSVRTTLPDPGTQDWPMGDAAGAEISPVDREAVAAAIDDGFRGDLTATAAVVVLHRGEIVGERYRDGIDAYTQLESWSMGKSLTGTLIGVLIQQGHLSLDQPAPIREWQGAGDPRADIRIRDLMQMSGGLLYSGQDDPRRRWPLGVPEHLYIYSDAVNAFERAISAPAEHTPGTVGRYRNCDPLTLGAIVRRTVTEKLGENYHQWPQAALFDRIGIRRQVLETDWYGNFLLTGFDYGTARNWSRLGQLYLQDGIWEGERVLPKGWSEFVSTPAPGWDEPRYGGQFWLNGTREFDLPEEAYFMAGYGEQRVFVVPSAELVVVRMGHRSDTDAPREATNAMLRQLMEAVRAA
ncbi:serine hydrolase domain-containing protein [Pseudonocardia nigra]|uniref:serine hydrolase domain-containing protein n=1 Tax=Pseudonocardia nigra TaxID=1921578 RepID=UPI001C5F942C|nr:serine hydrolase [Pseudonocardia nigra]